MALGVVAGFTGRRKSRSIPLGSFREKGSSEQSDAVSFDGRNLQAGYLFDGKIPETTQGQAAIRVTLQMTKSRKGPESVRASCCAEECGYGADPGESAGGGFEVRIAGE